MALLSIPVLNNDPILRTPNSEPHRRLGRFLGMAVVDLLPTVIFGALTGLFVSYYHLQFQKKTFYSLLGIFTFFIYGIIIHAITNIKTPLNCFILRNC